MPSKTAEVRAAIDGLDTERRNLSTLPPHDFMRMDVADRLRGKIAHLEALTIAKGNLREAQARERAIANALDLVLRWQHAHGESRRPRRGGCCGR